MQKIYLDKSKCQRLDFTGVLRPTGNNLVVSEFDEMLDVIYTDLNSKWRTPLDPSRMVYDTPFWNGNGRIQLFTPEYPDETLCLEGVCAPRSAVNYTGVGMYSAHVGEPLWLGKAEVFIWNGLVWGNTATQEELYFFEYGYNAYIERDTNE